MKIQTIVSICVKIIVVFYAMSSINKIPEAVTSIILTLQMNDLIVQNKLLLSANIIIPFVTFIFAVILIVKSDALTKLLYHSDENINFTIVNFFPNTAMVLSLKIFGIVAILRIVPQISYFLSRYYVMGENFKYYETTAKIQLVSSVFSALFYLGIGAFLIFRADKIAGILTQNEISESNK